MFTLQQQASAVIKTNLVHPVVVIPSGVFTLVLCQTGNVLKAISLT
ncbi:hypothetical protein AB6F61_18535 [Providencia hangzhouensis]